MGSDGVDSGQYSTAASALTGSLWKTSTITNSNPLSYLLATLQGQRGDYVTSRDLRAQMEHPLHC